MASPTPIIPSLDWLRSLPKVEMHAHLSGSVRDATIRQMLQEEATAAGRDGPLADESCLSTFVSGERSLSQCFEVFALLHRLLSSLSAVSRVTREVIADFAADEVVYLELRTTPRAMPAQGTSRRDYVKCVVDTIRECQHTMRTPRGRPIFVRLLLSINRSGSQADAADTVDLAAEFAAQADPIVVGLDFSGNPTVSSFAAFEQHFARARQLGLKASVHVGEKAGDEDDLDLVLDKFRPERIGHVVCLEPRHTALLLSRPIAVEICPTSNLKTRIVQQLSEHPFGTWRKSAEGLAAASYPLVVCTDDSGVFGITLSEELHRLAEAFGMTAAEMVELETRALEHGFADEACKQALRDLFAQYAASPITQSVLSDPRPLAVLTSAEELNSNPSDLALMAAFKLEGLAVEHVAWSAPQVQWQKYRGMVVRTVWDCYESAENTAGLLRVLDAVAAAGVPLFNSAATVRWNHSKTYMKELQQLGVNCVDTLWVDRLGQVEDAEATLEQLIREKGWGADAVMKPQVSSSGMHTYRFCADGSSQTLMPFASCLRMCRESGIDAWMIQPFCNEILAEGEFSYVFVTGEYSHCVLNIPAGAPPEAQQEPGWSHATGRQAASAEDTAAAREAAAKSHTSFMVQQCHGGTGRYVTPTADLVSQARTILHSTPYGRDSLYARVDCIRRGATLFVGELELIEPELFGRGVKGFHEKFVRATEARIAQFRQQQGNKQ